MANTASGNRQSIDLRVAIGELIEAMLNERDMRNGPFGGDEYIGREKYIVKQKGDAVEQCIDSLLYYCTK